MSLSFKSNSGLSLIEILVSIGLTAGIGMMVVETQKTTHSQVATVKTAMHSQLLKKSVTKQISNLSFLMGEFRNDNGSAIKNCIPDMDDVVNKRYGNMFIGCNVSGTHQANLKAGPGFTGVAEGKYALKSSSPTYYKADGSPCTNTNSASCVMAAILYFEPICNTGGCSQDGPDLLKLTIDIRNHGKDKNLAFDAKDTVDRSVTVHDMTPFKSMSVAVIEDQQGCPTRIDGYSDQLGFPISIKQGKVTCGYFRPSNFIGDRGPQGYKGPTGNRGFQGPTGRGCTGDLKAKPGFLTLDHLLAQGCDPRITGCGHIARPRVMYVTNC